MPHWVSNLIALIAGSGRQTEPSTPLFPGAAGGEESRRAPAPRARRLAALGTTALLALGFPALVTSGRAAEARQSVDLLVAGGTVVTMDASRTVIDDGALAVRGDAIVAVGTRASLEARFQATRHLEAHGMLVMPGLINGHTHAPMTLLRGLADDASLHDWLTQYIFPAEARNVTPDFVTWGTRLADLEMLHSGVTTYADMYYFEDNVARETKAAGMRGVLGETLIGFPAPDNKTSAQALAYTENYLRHWQGDPLIHAAVAPHSIYTVPEDLLQQSAALARRYHAPILIHVAEAKSELEESMQKHGMSPVAYLDKIGLLGPDVVAAHCIWVNAGDIATFVRREVGCVHNPTSNMILASGVAPLTQMLAAGMRLGLGTDGSAGGNHDLDLMNEIGLAAELQKVTRNDPQALKAEQVVALATSGGAQALHMEKQIGSLEPGKKADFILINLHSPDGIPMYNVYSQIAYSLRAADVRTVVVGGRILMRDGHVLTVNEPEVLAKAEEYSRRIKQSLAAKP